MKTCPHCAETIQDAAIVCRFCGRDLPQQPHATTPTPRQPEKKIAKIIVAAALVSFLGILALVSLSSDRETAEQRPARQRAAQRTAQEAENVQKRAELLQELTSKGVLKSLNCESGEAQVSPLAWLALDADGKKNFTMLLANRCHDTQKTAWVSMIDGQTGRELARFDGSGYSVR